MDIFEMGKEEKIRYTDRYSFLSMDAYDTDLFSGKYDVVCLSPLMDATLAVYKSKSTGKLIPYGLYNLPMTDRKNWNNYVNRNVMTARSHFDLSELEEFEREFEQIEYKPDMVVKNLQSIMDEVHKINSRTKFVILLLGEMPYRHNEKDRYMMEGKEITHRAINNAIRQHFKKNDDIYLLDINKYIYKQSDYFDNINHYSKLVYYHMAQEFIQYLSDQDGIEISVKPKSVAVWENIKRNVIYKYLFIKKKLYGKRN